MTIEKIVELCERKKQAAMLLNNNPEEAIRKFPECLHCVGYKDMVSCPEYVPQVVMSASYRRFLKVSREYFKV